MQEDDQNQHSDGREQGLEGWKQQTKAIERVIDVVLTVEAPKTAGWIADEALVSQQTARDHLDLLAEQLGVITRTTRSGVTKYQPDAAFLRYREISSLVEQYGDKEELMERVEQAQTRIEEIEDTFDAERPDDLRARAASDGVSTEGVREYKKAASEWETLRYKLGLLRDAVTRYEEFVQPQTRT